MRGGLLHWYTGLAAASVLGACSQIIGLSDYEIDSPSESMAGAPSTSDGGEPSGNGGESGGSKSGGTSNGGTPNGGTGAGEAGATTGEGGGGTEPAGCKSNRDCDDTIDCTTDTCGPAGVCAHAPVDSACDASRCEACVLNIGCVEQAHTDQQLLVDPAFDSSSTDWSQTSDRFGKNIFSDANAHSPTMIARFGPAAAAAEEQEYADLLQYVTIPDGTVALTLKGYYKLAPGVKAPSSDYVAIGFWEGNEIMPFAQFHSFNGNGGAKTTWTAFSYQLTGNDIVDMPGNEYTFDLVANTWDSVYQFDSLAVNATICQ